MHVYICIHTRARLSQLYEGVKPTGELEKFEATPDEVELNDKRFKHNITCIPYGKNFGGKNIGELVLLKIRCLPAYICTLIHTVWNSVHSEFL